MVKMALQFLKNALLDRYKEEDNNLFFLQEKSNRPKWQQKGHY